MINKIEHIIWDLDGTLINSEPEIREHLAVAITAAGLTPQDQTGELRIGPTLDKLILNAYKNATQQQIKAVNDLYRKSYDNCGFERTIPFSGIEDILNSNQNITHHLVTNKPSSATIQILQKLGWNNHFSSVKTPRLIDGVPSTKTQLFAEVIREFEADSMNVIGIGDMPMDAQAASANDIYAVGVTWGTGQIRELEPYCDSVMTDVEELKKFIALRQQP